MNRQSKVMKSERHIEDPDIILIGSGIMSATLGVVLKELDPKLKIQIYEAAEGISSEASDCWHNAGTGHAGLCELSYTPNYSSDGEVCVDKAIEIFQEFTHSLQFWGYAARKGIIKNPKECVNAVPHLSFVYGKEQVNSYVLVSPNEETSFLPRNGIFRRSYKDPRVGSTYFGRPRK